MLSLRTGLDQHGSFIKPFDVAKALSLYQQIFDPAEPMLEGARHVFVVPDGALQSLPLGVLVTEEPEGPVWKVDVIRGALTPPWHPTDVRSG